ncbi:MAG: YetF domain-containing protein [Chloroflexota bacterium]
MTIPDLGSGLLDVVARTAIVYLAILVLLRVTGKREVGQLSMLDFVLVLLISNGVQNAMVGDNVTLAGGVAAALTLVALDRGLGLLRDRFPRVRRVVEGEPRLLVRHGTVLRRAMRDESVTQAELLAALREHGLVRVEDVELAVLETTGTISVIPRANAGGGGGEDGGRRPAGG